ncbi:MAG TPA: energy transducer TonB [Allosphingosinicella sp.]
MTATGFLEQKPRSPTGFGLVLLLHGAAIAGVVMIKGPAFLPADNPLVAVFVPKPPDPPPIDRPQPTPRNEVRRSAPSTTFVPDTVVDPPPTGETFAGGPPTEGFDPRPATGELGTGGGGTGETIPVERPRPAPVRTEALFGRGVEQQPPYPLSEIRGGREGSVRVQVRIGTDGRVKGVTRLSATSDAFWRATERHALSSWRFRPATEDGRPVESSKTLTVHFRLDGS